MNLDVDLRCEITWLFDKSLKLAQDELHDLLDVFKRCLVSLLIKVSVDERKYWHYSLDGGCSLIVP